MIKLLYQLLAHGRWFSPASSTTKAGRHDIAEILLKVALKHQKSKHFVLCCEALHDIREPLINRIIAIGSAVLAKIKASQPIDILKLINPFIYVDKYDITQKKSLNTIGEVLEPLCRVII